MKSINSTSGQLWCSRNTSESTDTKSQLSAVQGRRRPAGSILHGSQSFVFLARARGPQLQASLDSEGHSRTHTEARRGFQEGRGLRSKPGEVPAECRKVGDRGLPHQLGTDGNEWEGGCMNAWKTELGEQIGGLQRGRRRKGEKAGSHQALSERVWSGATHL